MFYVYTCTQVDPVKAIKNTKYLNLFCVFELFYFMN